MIILTQSQRDFFLEFKKDFQSVLDSRGIDIIPIPILNNLYILPEGIFSDINFVELNNALNAIGYLNNLIIREVLESEYIICPI